MHDGAVDTSGLGAVVEEAPIPGGLRKRKDSGRRAYRFEGGLAVEDREGPVVLPYASTRVFTTDPPQWEPHDDPARKAQWAFERDDGVRWDTGSIERHAPVARLCSAAATASVGVRLALARERLAAGEQVDFALLALTAHDLLVPGQRPLPWAEVTGIETGAEGSVLLSTAGGGELTFSPLRGLADAAVLVTLVEERF